MLALDPGSTWIRAARKGEAPAFQEPAVVARDSGSSKEIALGQEALHQARSQLGRGGVQLIRPFFGGRILDWEAALSLVRLALGSLHKKRSRIPVALAVAADSSLVERRAWSQLLSEAGASKVELLESPLCAAMGCGCEIERPQARAVFHWGGSTLDCGLLAGGQLLYAESVQLGGLELDRAVERWVRQNHGILISPLQAEEVKCKLLSALALSRATRMELTGFGLVDGLPRTFELDQAPLQEAIQPYLLVLRESLLRLLSQATPECCADLLQEGLWLCGGSSQLRALKDFLEQVSGLSALPVEQPQEAVIRGLSEWMRRKN